MRNKSKITCKAISMQRFGEIVEHESLNILPGLYNNDVPKRNKHANP